MKKNKRTFALLLVCVLVIGMTSNFALAADISMVNSEQTYIVDCSITVEEALSRAYSNLSPEAKTIFNTTISGNAALVEYHKNNIDYTYTERQVATMALSGGAAEIVSSGLVNMGLPTQVQEALNLLSSGIVAALADGPLVAGDIYSLAVSLYTAVVIATYWDEIMAKWDDIVALFQSAYTSVRTAISSAMNIIEEDIADECSLPDTATVTVNQTSRTIRVEDRYYVCSTAITEFSPVQERFYPAIVTGTLWVCPTYVSFKVARIIMGLNIDLSGVLTKYRDLAYTLCNTLGTPVLDVSDVHNPNYLSHYHYIKSGVRYRPHAWFVM